MTRHKVYDMRFGSVYPAYVAKAERKGRTKAEVDEIICWLTGHDQASLDAVIASETNCEAFITGAPRLNPARELITGSVCGVKVQDVQEPVMRELRYMDKLIDELAKGRIRVKRYVTHEPRFAPFALTAVLLWMMALAMTLSMKYLRRFP